MRSNRNWWTQEKIRLLNKIVKRMEVVERIWGDSLPLHLLSCESWIFMKKKPDRKTKTKLCFTTRINRLSVYVDEERLESFMTEVSIIQRSNHWFAEQINGLITIRKEHPSWKSQCFATCMYLHDIYVSKYQRRMLLINPLSKAKLLKRLTLKNT